MKNAQKIDPTHSDPFSLRFIDNAYRHITACERPLNI